MDGAFLSLLMAALIFVASIISIEAAVSVAIMEIVVGVLGGNFLGLAPTPSIDFLAGLASILLTFLAGAEVDVDVMRSKLKESLLIGGVSFLAPFLGAFAYAYWVAGWTFQAAEIAGVALSTTSLAVVYAVLVETGLTDTEIGKIIMASCFVTDFGTALALSVLFAEANWFLLVFIVVSALIIILVPRMIPWLFKRYGDKVIEPEIKFLLLILFLFMWLGKLGASHAVLPAFIFGLALSKTFSEYRMVQRRLRIVAFALLTPFFFIKAGMNVSLSEIRANLGLLAMLFAVKQVTKIAGIYPLAKKYVPKDAVYTTLLMSTGLTFGTISSMYGLSAGIINTTQFSLLVTAVVLSAIVPTFIAQKWFEPLHYLNGKNEIQATGKDTVNGSYLKEQASPNLPGQFEQSGA